MSHRPTPPFPSITGADRNNQTVNQTLSSGKDGKKYAGVETSVGTLLVWITGVMLLISGVELGL